jgi:hypothetical protein
MNNRQNGRRRGRGGQQVRNGQPGNNQDRGNRIDNRARGNAAQLLEKYKNLASESQRQGDRVNTEYYLQFADHYFRVLSESRARFEEQRPAEQRHPRDYRDDFNQDEEGEGEGQRYDQSDANWGDASEEGQPQQARSNDRRPDPRQPDQRPRYEERPADAEEGDEQRYENERRARRPRNGRANGNGNGNGNGESHLQEELADRPFSERIEVDRLPQALTPAPIANDAEPIPAEPEAPRRRRAPRRPRDEAVVEA